MSSLSPSHAYIYKHPVKTSSDSDDEVPEGK
jgi:hypothetical protein